MNILLITNDWKPKTGGISTYLRSLVENLDHKFFIYGPSWIEGNDAYPAADTFIINPRKVFEDIQKIVNDNQIDIILHGSSNPNFLFVNKLNTLDVPNSPKNVKIPQYMICHGAEFNVLNYIPIVRNLLSRNLDNLNTIFTVSEFSRKKLVDITDTEIINIGAGIEIPNYENSYENNVPLTIGVVSRLVSRKKISWLIDVAHDLKEEGLPIELKILGFGKQENYLKKLSSVSAANVTFIKEETEKDVDEFL
ncbi:MAG: hypothetical protein Ct9H90mP10_00490 [Actinomycetota bacterium]|nr:MAG: hypothetical protein Ct9H90mP10_00490 [Actinomycetota bacterium]